MSLRAFIADLISGGEITRSRRYHAQVAHEASCHIGMLEYKLESSREEYSRLAKCAETQAKQNLRFMQIMEEVQAMETPRANATVRRMARKLREAVQ